MMSCHLLQLLAAEAAELRQKFGEEDLAGRNNPLSSSLLSCLFGNKSEG
jgi:hypothetical protein